MGQFAPNETGTRLTSFALCEAVYYDSIRTEQRRRTAAGPTGSMERGTFSGLFSNLVKLDEEVSLPFLDCASMDDCVCFV